MCDLAPCAAAQALARERVALQAAGGGDAEMAALEQHLVALLADAVAADLVSGHTELALARMQTALEFNCFAPAIFGGIPACVSL